MDTITPTTRITRRISRRLAHPIPHEVIEQFFDPLDQRDLAEVVRVCKEWRALATRFLYRRIHIQCDLLWKLCRVWDNTPKLASYIVTFTLIEFRRNNLLADGEYDRFYTCLRNLTPFLQSVREIKLMVDVFSAYGNAITELLLGSYPLLSGFTLKPPRKSDSILIPFLNRHPHLKSVAIGFPPAASNIPSNDIALQLPHLTQFQGSDAYFMALHTFVSNLTGLRLNVSNWNSDLLERLVSAHRLRSLDVMLDNPDLQAFEILDNIAKLHLPLTTLCITQKNEHKRSTFDLHIFALCLERLPELRSLVLDSWDGEYYDTTYTLRDTEGKGYDDAIGRDGFSPSVWSGTDEDVLAEINRRKRNRGHELETLQINRHTWTFQWKATSEKKSDTVFDIQVLHGHVDNVHSMDFSADGKSLASGGDDARVIIFDTASWRAKKIYTVVAPVRAVVWHPAHRGAISVGLKNGIIHTIQTKNDLMFEHSVAGTIHCMAVDAKGSFLAIGFNNEVQIVRQSSISAWSSERYVPRPPNVNNGQDITRSIRFHTQERTLLVTYLYAGIRAYDLDDITILKWQIKIEGACGQSALSATSRHLVTSVLLKGIQWLDVTKRKIEFEQSIEIDHDSILPVTFVGPTVVAVGSKTGNVLLFKLGRSEVTQLLNHNDNFVQSLAYVYKKREGSHLLVTGQSGQYDETVLTVWKSQGDVKKTATPWRAMILGFGTILAGVLGARYKHNVQVSIEHLTPSEWPTFSMMQSHPTTDASAQVYTKIVTKTIEVPASLQSNAPSSEIETKSVFTSLDNGRKPLSTTAANTIIEEPHTVA
ncbi:hypothetical protein C8R47DRAFT_1228852 [Mycena vitilis]|nr:hypothetical protein C8R47DRAFT_1228852 [Mycena vitilis]